MKQQKINIIYIYPLSGHTLIGFFKKKNTKSFTKVLLMAAAVRTMTNTSLRSATERAMQQQQQRAPPPAPPIVFPPNLAEDNQGAALQGPGFLDCKNILFFISFVWIMHSIIQQHS